MQTFNLSRSGTSLPCIGKTIIKAELAGGDLDEALVLRFDDGSELEILDDGQSCCEIRYITCDDPLEQYAGARFLGIEEREVVYDSDEDDFDCHDIMFVVVLTDRGNISLCSHNEHNGYYGGFRVVANYEQQPGPDPLAERRMEVMGNVTGGKEL